MKISFISDPDRYAKSQMQSLVDFVSLYIPELRLTHQDDAELLFVHHQQYKPSNAKIIVVERADSSTWGYSRPLIKEENVLAVFKHTLLDSRFQNDPFCFRRYHINLLDDCYNLEHDRVRLEFVSENELSRLYCRVPIIFRWRQSHVKIPDMRHVLKRNNVLNRASIQKLSHIEKHRGDCVSKFKGSEKILGRSLWVRALAESKICVCPWGYGEMCYRDYEAMMCRCIVVKPNTDFMVTWPNIYKANETYIPCRLDFSDLEDICDDVLCNYEKYQDMLNRNFWQVYSPDVETMAVEFKDALRSLGIVI